MKKEFFFDLGLKTFIAIDVETTGLNIYNDKIIEISACKYIDGKLNSTFSKLINPHQTISPFIENLTGIKNKDLINKPTFSEISSEFVDFVKDYPIVGHNIMFDLKFINQSLKKQYDLLSNNYICDTYYLSKIFLFYSESFKLTSLCDNFNIEIHTSHRAEDDAKNSAELFIEILKILMSIDAKFLSIINICSRYVRVLNKKLISELLKIKLNTNSIQNNDFYLDKVPQKFVYNYSSKENSNIDVSLENVFSNDGLLASLIPNYDFRKNQYSLAEDYAKNIVESAVMVAEADTGIGKTFSYIAASLLRRKQNKVVISSSTHNLQNQLFYKDIPLISKALNIEVKATISKGMNNYLCKQRLNKFIDIFKDVLDESEVFEFMSLLVWSELTQTGDISECNSFKVKNNHKIWNYVKYESESCMFATKNHTEDCFYQIMINEARKSNILVVNHALLATSLEKNESFISEEAECIIDEAHKFAETCRDQLTRTSSKNMFDSIYSDLDVFFNKINKKYHLDKNILNDFINIKEASLLFIKNFNDFSSECLQQISLRKKSLGSNFIDIRYTFNNNFNNNFSLPPNNLCSECEKIVNLVEKLIDDLLTNSIFSKSECLNLKIFLSKFSEFKSNLQLNLNQNDYINWLTVNSYNNYNVVSFNSSPFYITRSIKTLINKFNSLLFCSATLSVNNDFDYFLNELGIEEYSIDKKIVCKHYHSNFHLNDQTKLFVMKSNFDINNEEYYNRLSNLIFKFSESLNKRMLVLCTSYSQIINFKKNIQNKSFKNFSKYLFQEKTSSKQILLKQYLNNSDSVLFGTNTFWEGIDLPEDKLEILLITKLPFSNPNAPIVQAKIDYYQSLGMSSFNDFQLPEAILKLRQGMGRLIRSQNDMGVCILTDPRLLNKRYGNIILESINLNPIIFNDDNLVLLESKKFLGS